MLAKLCNANSTTALLSQATQSTKEVRISSLDINRTQKSCLLNSNKLSSVLCLKTVGSNKARVSCWNKISKSLIFHSLNNMHSVRFKTTSSRPRSSNLSSLSRLSSSRTYTQWSKTDNLTQRQATSKWVLWMPKTSTWILCRSRSRSLQTTSTKTSWEAHSVASRWATL